jgi:hypothetical protein
MTTTSIVMTSRAERQIVGETALHSRPRPSVSRLALSPSEAAESLGVSRDFFDEHVGPELRIIRRGRRKLIDIRELQRWLSEESAFALERTSTRCR